MEGYLHDVDESTAAILPQSQSEVARRVVAVLHVHGVGLCLG